MSSKIDLLIRTLQLASFGLGKVSSAPLTGWILTSDEHIILAEGWLPHQSLSSASLSLNEDRLKIASGRQNILYINTLASVMPELISFLSAFHVSKICVAIGVEASDKQLLPKNILCEDNLLSKYELYLNRRFYVYSRKKRPYIILKWAETFDGFIARENYDSKWISNTQSRRLVHKWRTEEDAIMVGTNTAHYDNPQLNVRSWTGRNPIRIVIDKTLRLKSQLNVFDGSQFTLCYNLHLNKVQNNIQWVRIPEPTDHLAFFTLLLHDLWQKKIQSVIVEGGSQLLHFLINYQLWDEARVFTSQQKFLKGISAPILTPELISETFCISDDLLKIYLHPKN